MISIFYTGDRRHNPVIAEQNHQRFFNIVGSIAPYSVHWFTKDRTQRNLCPWEDHTDDVKLRRGQGGAVQVWDFMNAAANVPDDIVIRMRTDLWFGLDSLEYVRQGLQRVVDGEVDVVYFGSDLINGNQGKTFEAKSVFKEGHVQDFMIIARKSRLETQEYVYYHIGELSPQKRRSGNKLFRLILPKDLDQCRAETHLCHIWLIRKWYDQYPRDQIVFKDYLDSYMSDAKNIKLITHGIVTENPLIPAYQWWQSFDWAGR